MKSFSESFWEREGLAYKFLFFSNNNFIRFNITTDTWLLRLGLVSVRHRLWWPNAACLTSPACHCATPLLSLSPCKLATWPSLNTGLYCPLCLHYKYPNVERIKVIQYFTTKTIDAASKEQHFITVLSKTHKINICKI